MEIIAPLESVRPDIVIHDYTNGIYKIVKHKSTAPRYFVDPEKFDHYDHKLDSSYSRAKRTILELALCNEWSYFCTFTLSPQKGNRQDLNTWHKKFTQWLRDQRKEFLKKGLDISLRFVLVPELHSDGLTWHMHGLFSDLSPVLISFDDLAAGGVPIPEKLLHRDYYNWPAYQNKFGWCSFGKIRNKVACGFYITKYVTKDLSKNSVDLGCSLYYPSRPLNRSKKHGEIYGSTNAFDQYLTNHYEFCSTGMTHVCDKLDWSFGLEYMDYTAISSFSFDQIDDQKEFADQIEDMLQFDQLNFQLG